VQKRSPAQLVFNNNNNDDGDGDGDAGKSLKKKLLNYVSIHGI
jgi:hypothetical protein